MSIPDSDPFALETFPKYKATTGLERLRCERRIVTAYRAGLSRNQISVRTGWSTWVVKTILADAALTELDRRRGLMSLVAVHISDLVWLRFCEGRSLEQIADDMEMTSETATQFLRFAKLVRRPRFVEHGKRASPW
ncbi:hypothetical protein NLX83_15455 [Allokutzneria sp. A3M-2-11 16]|uniref:hypothetical protein n=1 Tax=Allokutzneria sp. A3M-2-11 16 TaxID=2962043 RepID=UPI0020B89AEC|nr:hypothetical protein [Allokutzneria sp. A3M-2-11 16]MCP3800663.1 hypothetical protein [Allokutzneria sp. A3M-2-11 16]